MLLADKNVRQKVRVILNISHSRTVVHKTRNHIQMHTHTPAFKHTYTQGFVYVIAEKGDLRPGLPTWVSSYVRTLDEDEAKGYGMPLMFGQGDVMMLLTQGTTWKVKMCEECLKSVIVRYVLHTGRMACL